MKIVHKTFVRCRNCFLEQLRSFARFETDKITADWFSSTGRASHPSGVVQEKRKKKIQPTEKQSRFKKKIYKNEEIMYVFTQIFTHTEYTPIHTWISTYTQCISQSAVLKSPQLQMWGFIKKDLWNQNVNYYNVLLTVYELSTAAVQSYGKPPWSAALGVLAVELDVLLSLTRLQWHYRVYMFTVAHSACTTKTSERKKKQIWSPRYKYIFWHISYAPLKSVSMTMITSTLIHIQT